MIIKAVKRLECVDCGVNANLRLCNLEVYGQLILCLDCLIDRQEEDGQEGEQVEEE